MTAASANSGMISFFPGQFADPVLLRTDLIPWEDNPVPFPPPGSQNQSDDEEQQERMIDAVDVIMQHAMENEEVFYFVLEYLINGFEKMEGMDQVSGTSYQSLPPWQYMLQGRKAA
jgi:hypothetical protein